MELEAIEALPVARRGRPDSPSLSVGAERASTRWAGGHARVGVYLQGQYRVA